MADPSSPIQCSSLNPMKHSSGLGHLNIDSNSLNSYHTTERIVEHVDCKALTLAASDEQRAVSDPNSGTVDRAQLTAHC